MTSLEILRHIAGGMRGQRDTALAGPWVVIAPDREPWTVATDGKALLWVRGALPDVPAADDAATYRLLPLWGPPEGHAGVECNRIDLVAFAGEARWRKTCPACNGTSMEFAQYVTCSLCDDCGLVYPTFWPGWLLDVPFDRVRLGQLLAAFTDPFVRLVVAPCPPPGKGPCLWMQAPTYRIAPTCRTVLTSVRRPAEFELTAEPWLSAPRFPPVTP